MLLIFYLFLFIVLFISELAYFKIADRCNIIDKPNLRSSHRRITLRGGGIVFFLGIILYFLFFSFQYPLFFTGLLMITIISFLDDIISISFKYRIAIHFFAMLIMFGDCGFYDLPWYFSFIALIVAIGILNAFNFMDGINGMTGGYSLVVIGSFAYINNIIHPFVDNHLLVVTSLSILVFGFFNFRNDARCFAGDVGSISIAFIVVFLLGKLIVETAQLSYLILLAVYGLDSVLTIIHRIVLRENIFEAHRKHAYQIMANEMQIPHLRISVLYMGLQAVVSIGFLIISPRIHWYYIFGVLLLLSFLYLIFMKKYFRLHLPEMHILESE